MILYAAQLYRDGAYRRYLRDWNKTPYFFPTKPEAHLFARQYLQVRKNKSLAVKIVEIKVELPKPPATQ